MSRHRDEGGGAPASAYQMRQQMFAIGDDFWIENEAGQRVFKVDGKALRIRKTLSSSTRRKRAVQDPGEARHGPGHDGDRGPSGPGRHRQEGPDLPAPRAVRP